MPSIKYTLSREKPSPKPAVYMSCLTNANYMAPRWWDGERWWDISAARGHHEIKPEQRFKWPAGSSVKKPSWMNDNWYRDRIVLRAINDQARVQWGTPYKQYEPEEVLKWMVLNGHLVSDWKEHYQDLMRAQNFNPRAKKQELTTATSEKPKVDARQVSYWQKGCNDARSGSPSMPGVFVQIAMAGEHDPNDTQLATRVQRGYMNGYQWGMHHPAHQYEPCGGCGTAHPDKVCIGCGHPFKRLN